jgi:hypothetical protein
MASLTVALPVLYDLAAGDGARVRLDAMKAWLVANNAAVSPRCSWSWASCSSARASKRSGPEPDMTSASAPDRKPHAGRARAGLLAIPGVRLVRTYDRSWLRTDALAALTVWALLVPQALAYAQLGGFDPVVGLYAAIGVLAGYVLLGGSGHAALPRSCSS